MASCPRLHPHDVAAGGLFFVVAKTATGGPFFVAAKTAAGGTILLCGSEKMESDADLVAATATAGGTFLRCIDSQV